jgi:hypothetical protein
VADEIDPAAPAEPPTEAAAVETSTTPVDLKKPSAPEAPDPEASAQADQDPAQDDQDPAQDDQGPEQADQDGAAPVPKRRSLVVAGWALLAVTLLAVTVGAIGFAMGRHGDDQTLRARPGDCFAGQSDSDLKRVSCTDRTVRWSVVGVVENKTEEQAKKDACDPWPQAEASYWESRNGSKGFVLCLVSTSDP